MSWPTTLFSVRARNMSIISYRFGGSRKKKEGRCFKKVLNFSGFRVGILFASFFPMVQKKSSKFSVKLGLRLTSWLVF